MEELTDQEAQILAFEHRWWARPGGKQRAIRDDLGLTEVRYYQLLNRLLDKPAALAADPIVVNTLRRTREREPRGSAAQDHV